MIPPLKGFYPPTIVIWQRLPSLSISRFLSAQGSGLYWQVLGDAWRCLLWKKNLYEQLLLQNIHLWLQHDDPSQPVVFYQKQGLGFHKSGLRSCFVPYPYPSLLPCCLQCHLSPACPTGFSLLRRKRGCPPHMLLPGLWPALREMASSKFINKNRKQCLMSNETKRHPHVARWGWTFPVKCRMTPTKGLVVPAPAWSCSCSSAGSCLLESRALFSLLQLFSGGSNPSKKFFSSLTQRSTTQPSASSQRISWNRCIYMLWERTSLKQLGHKCFWCAVYGIFFL